MEVKIDSRSMNLALAVNMGMVNVSDLNMVARDADLKILTKSLVSDKFMTKDEAKTLNGYFDTQFLPMDPIYCITYTNSSLKAASSASSGSLLGDDFSITDDGGGTVEELTDDTSGSSRVEKPSGYPSLTLYLSVIVRGINGKKFASGSDVDSVCAVMKIIYIISHLVISVTIDQINVCRRP